jgi:peroxiredoxin
MKRITLFLLISFVLLTAVARAIATEGSVVGQPAPDFTLKDLNGKTHSLKDHRGQIAVIVFVSTECPFSNAYIERLRAIASDYSKKNVTLLGVNANPAESLAQIREHAGKNKLDFTILKDEGSRVADAYGATRTPEVFVVDGSGVLRYRGRIDNAKEIARVQRSDLREALDEMIAGKPVSVAETKSFGCPIKMVRKNAAASGGQQSGIEELAFIQASYSPNLASAFVPQKKPARKPAAAKKSAAPAAAPQVALLKPEDFNKFKDAANGKVLVINFWATWCGPCIAEFPEFVALDRKYRAKGVKVVGISADEVTDIKRKVIPFIRRQKVQFDIVVQDTDDPQQMIDAVYKEWAGELPATFVYDKQGNLVYKHLGIINRDELVAEIEKALK